MKTDDLIEALARGGEPVPAARPKRRLAAALAVGLAIAAALVLASVGLRPDIGVALIPVLLKAGFSAAAAAVLLPLLMRLLRPGRPLGWRIGAVAGFAALCALLTVIALAGAEPGQRFKVWMGGGLPWCVVVIPLLAAPAAGALILLARAFAPTRLTLTGAALGGLAGGIGAMAYAMYCPVDQVAFVATWYAAGIGLSAAIGALLGAHLLRW